MGNTVAELTRRVLEAQHTSKKTKCEAILDKFTEMALAGSKPHADFLFERGYGRVKEIIETITPVNDQPSKVFEQLLDANLAFRAAFVAAMKNGNGHNGNGSAG